MEQRPHLRPHHAGGREDCWSDGATEALVEAWGDRYVRLGRGNLRQKDWREVADAVNAHQSALGRPRRTDVQCKNRVDTLKKKYKSEKAKRGPSLWPFFSRLHCLISDRPPSSLSSRGDRSPVPAADDDDDYGGTNERAVRRPVQTGESLRKRRCRNGNGDDDEAFAELARAITGFVEVYERVEGMKQRHMAEMERQRMEFAKKLELQRMQVFMEAQLELEKLKRPRGVSGSTGLTIDMGRPFSS